MKRTTNCELLAGEHTSLGSGHRKGGALREYDDENVLGLAMLDYGVAAGFHVGCRVIFPLIFGVLFSSYHYSGLVGGAVHSWVASLILPVPSLISTTQTLPFCQQHSRSEWRTVFFLPHRRQMNLQHREAEQVAWVQQPSKLYCLSCSLCLTPSPVGLFPVTQDVLRSLPHPPTLRPHQVTPWSNRVLRDLCQNGPHLSFQVWRRLRLPQEFRLHHQQPRRQEFHPSPGEPHRHKTGLLRPQIPQLLSLLQQERD